MEKTLTIIIPAYNISKYIDNIMKSLLDSKFKEELQILIVDDGSKDETKKLAEDYEKSFPGIVTCLSKVNGGHGSTINYAVPRSIGKYIKSIDGDDWVDTVELDKTIECLRNIESDIVATGYTIINPDDNTKRVIIPHIDKYNKEYDFLTICNKIESIEYHSIVFKTDFLKNNYRNLDENCFYVDCEYIIYPLKYAHTITFLDTNVYMYRVGTVEQSVNINSRIKNRNMLKTVINSLIKFYNEIENPNLKVYIGNRIKQLIITLYSVLLKMASSQGKNELKEFDRHLKLTNRYFYKSVQFRFKLLRLSCYSTYSILSYIIIRKNKLENC